MYNRLEGYAAELSWDYDRTQLDKPNGGQFLVEWLKALIKREPAWVLWRRSKQLPYQEKSDRKMMSPGCGLGDDVYIANAEKPVASFPNLLDVCY